MIIIDGKRFRTLQDKIYASNNRQILKVFADDVQVYPGLPHRALCTGSWSIESKSISTTSPVGNRTFENFKIEILFELLLESDEPFSFEKNSAGNLLLLDRYGNRCSAYTDQYFHFDATGSIKTYGAPTADNVYFGGSRVYIGPFLVAVDAADFGIYNEQITRLSGVVSGRDTLEKRRIVIPDDDSEYALNPDFTGLSVPYQTVNYGATNYGAPPSIYIHLYDGVHSRADYNTFGYRRGYTLISRFNMFGGVPNELIFGDVGIPCNVVAIGNGDIYDCVNHTTASSVSVPGSFGLGDQSVYLTDYQFL